MSDQFDPLDFLPDVGPGRKAIPLTAEYSRDLTPADFSAPAVVTQTSAPLVKIRDAHHALARVLATGIGEGEASLITGYSPSRISILKNDPQFQELLSFYRSTGTSQVADMRERMTNLGLTAISELQERLEENPTDFSPALLKDIAKDMADRVGHAPKAASGGGNVNVNINLNDRMAEARNRVEAARKAKVIDHE